MSKHTPEPWVVESGMIWERRMRPDGQFAPIARMDRDTPYTRPVERDANARAAIARAEGGAA